MPRVFHKNQPVSRNENAEQQFLAQLADWRDDPVHFVTECIGAQPDPWQCDVMDALMAEDNVAIRACHGVGKTVLLAWVVLWFLSTRPYSKVPTTAPTFNKQVKDVLWGGGIHHWWRVAQDTSPWLANFFELTTTRMQHVRYPAEWFAVGIASSQPINIEGYHAPHILVVIDEAKGIPTRTWESIAGMRTTQEAKLLVASTPGGPIGEFYKIYTKYRQTWKSLYVIHPEPLRSKIARPEAPHFSRGGTYYSNRVPASWVERLRLEWGEDSPVYIARVIGDFPTVEGDVLIPLHWLEEAEHLEAGKIGPRVVSCDVARYGRDRTVLLAGEGGTLVHGETIAHTASASTAPEIIETFGTGDDPKRPRYRSIPATASACRRLRIKYEADYIVVDDTGLGGGVTDILKEWGENVIPINFGTAPTDKVRDPDVRAWRERLHLGDSHFVNFKAQMAWALRAALEVGDISFAHLPREISESLVSQCSMVRRDMDVLGRIKIIDPDEQDELAVQIGEVEGKRSPDHFHSLIMYWWVAGQPVPMLAPKSGPIIPDGIARHGNNIGQLGRSTSPRPVGVAGQASWVQRWFK